MERHEVFEMMRALKLVAPQVRVPRNGMRAAYDETMRAGIQHKLLRSRDPRRSPEGRTG